MDIFCEYMVKHEKGTKEIFKTVGIIAAALCLSVLFLVFGVYLIGLAPLFIAGALYGAYWLISRMNIEYEYILTSTVLDIDKIMARRSRKRILSIDLKEISVCESAGNMEKQEGIKLIDATPKGIEDGVYGIDFEKNGMKNRLLFKPNKKMLNQIKKASPSLVKLRLEDVER